MKRIFSAGRGLAFIVFMTVFLFTGCGQSAEPKSEVKNPTLHDAAVKMVAGMSLEEKIGQMLLIGIDGTEIDEGALSMLRDYHVGGVILFDRNMNNKYQVTGLNANLQRLNKEYNKLPLYLCVDQEGGMVARMKQGLTVAPAAARIAEQGTPEDARRWAYQTAMELETIGFNVNFAPVLDIGPSVTLAIVTFVESYCTAKSTPTKSFAVRFSKLTLATNVLSALTATSSTEINTVFA